MAHGTVLLWDLPEHSRSACPVVPSVRVWHELLQLKPSHISFIALERKNAGKMQMSAWKHFHFGWELGTAWPRQAGRAAMSLLWESEGTKLLVGQGRFPGSLVGLGKKTPN